MDKFFKELRRRNVFRVAGVYAVVGWLLIQVIVAVKAPLHLPAWTDTFFVLLVLAGFPVALILAWAFEMTPEGMKLTANVDEGDSISAKTGKKLDYMIIGGLALVAVMIVADRLMPGKVPATGAQTTASQSAMPAGSIAVLPFADLSPDGDQEYFADGIAEEILNVLAGLNAFEVTSRTSAFAFKSQSQLGVKDIAAALNVRHVLEGSVRKAGANVRITAQLIDTTTDQHLWSQTYDRALTAENVFAIQDEIAGAITAELAKRLDVKVSLPAATSHAGGTSEISAYEAYLKGRDLFRNRNYEKLPFAIDYLEQAVAADPQFARARGLLAAAYAVAPDWAFFDRDYPTLAADAAARALALDPENSMALTALAQNASDTDEQSEATIDYLKRAVASDPQNTTALLWLGQTYSRLGFFDRAEDAVRQCLDIDAGYPVCVFTYAEIAMLSHRYDEGLDRLHQLMATTHQESYSAFLAVVAERESPFTLEFMLREGADQMPGDARWIVPYLKRALGDEDYDRAAELAVVEKRLADQGFAMTDDPYVASVVFLSFGAFDRLPTEYIGDWWWYPGYKGLRESKARYDAMRKAGLYDYWRAHGFPPQCKPVGSDDFECE